MNCLMICINKKCAKRCYHEVLFYSKRALKNLFFCQITSKIQVFFSVNSNSFVANYWYLRNSHTYIFESSFLQFFGNVLGIRNMTGIFAKINDWVSFILLIMLSCYVKSKLRLLLFVFLCLQRKALLLHAIHESL